jgi:hypothetical protein
VAADYRETFEALGSVCLEDTWVLAVRPSDGQVAFALDVVLTEAHPDYQSAKDGEQYDYRLADLVVTGDELHVELSRARPAIDASGETDLGNIDSWCTDADGWSVLEGEWGTVRVLRPTVRLNFADGG